MHDSISAGTIFIPWRSALGWHLLNINGVENSSLHAFKEGYSYSTAVEWGPSSFKYHIIFRAAPIVVIMGRGHVTRNLRVPNQRHFLYDVVNDFFNFILH
jgi:hypothetical protein